MLGAIQRGDKVMTSGGIIGKVIKVNEEDVTIDVAPNGTRLQVRRGMIADVIGPKAANDQAKKK